MTDELMALCELWMPSPAAAEAKAHIAALIAERDALREALRAVLDGHGCQPGYLSHSAMQIARAALEARHDTK